MFLHEKELLIPFAKSENLLPYYSDYLSNHIALNEIPIRFVITKMDEKGFHCELGMLSGLDHSHYPESIFKLRKRAYENTENFNTVLLVPTGIGAEIGGHSGDATPVARLLAAISDNLITHPNVVNASDINELPENALYVEGSVISNLLMGSVSLQKVRSNRILTVLDKHSDKFFYESAVNSISSARASMGVDCVDVILMKETMAMRALYSSSGRAVGRIDGFEKICEVLSQTRSKYDAVALSSIIQIPQDFHQKYFSSEEMVNPWGGVEAMLTHGISSLFDVPSAHSPMLESRDILNLDFGMVDPRKAAEAISTTFLHCILKGLHKSPRIIRNQFCNPGLISAEDVSCIVIPYGCIGLPTLAAIEQRIPLIAVKNNLNRMQNRLEDLLFDSNKLIIVNNYLEAAGVILALKSGVSIESIRRPLGYTKVSELKNLLNRTFKLQKDTSDQPDIRFNKI